MYADRVFETSTTSGTADMVLAGAVTGYRTFFAAFGTGVSFKYAIAHRTLNQWEIGEGTISLVSGSYVLARTTIEESSNAGSKVNFSAGPKDVFHTLTAASIEDFSAGGSSLPVTDTTALVKDPADNTKLGRIDVGAVPTGTTRTIVMGDRDVDLANGGTFAERVHTHPQSEITGLETALSGKAATSHTHSVSDITSLLEYIQDAVAAMAVAGSGISVSYDDSAGTLTLSVTGGGGGGASALGDSSDVALSSPSTGQSLIYDGTNWTNGMAFAGINLDGVNDVDATSPSDGDVLSFDSGSGHWVAEAPTAGSVDWEDITGKPGSFPPESHEHSLGDLVDVTTSGATVGQLLGFDGSEWVPVSAGGATNLNGLSDVVLDTPANGQTLIFNGTEWVNEAFAGDSLLPVNDTTALVRDPTDTTKKVRIDAGEVETATTRTLWFPNSDFDLRDFQCHPLHRPKTAHSLDDEFDGSSLSGDWTWVNQGSATASVADGCLKLTSATGTNGTTHNLHCLIKSIDLTTGDWKCFAKVGIRVDGTASFNTVDYIRAGLVMQDHSTGKVEGLVVTHNSSINGTAPNIGVTAVKYNSATSANSIYAQRAVVHGKSLYLVFLKSGSTIYAGYSIDGDETILLTSWTQTGFLATPDRIGLACDALNASSKKCVLLSPFFRFEDL